MAPPRNVHPLQLASLTTSTRSEARRVHGLCTHSARFTTVVVSVGFGLLNAF